MKNNRKNLQPISLMEIIILFLSTYVLAVLLVEVIFSEYLTADARYIISVMDTVISFIFLADFFYRFYNAENKVTFMKWGWIDFISSIPLVDSLRWGRAIRVFRVLRTLRGLRAVKVIVDFALRYRARSAFGSVVVISIILLTWSSVAILAVEVSDDSNIKNAHDALWWSFVTITTVGYGDFYPVTFEGRVIAVILMVAGVGLFGTFTGFVTSWFLEDDLAEEKEQTVTLHEIQQELQLLRRELAKQGITVVPSDNNSQYDVKKCNVEGDE